MKNRDIDWDGNCIFDGNGKVVEFKTQLSSNSFSMRPIPTTEDVMGDAIEADKLLSSIMRPATKDQIALAIKKLALHCGLQGKAPEEVQYMFIDYCHDLAEYPAALIDEACAEYRKLPDGNNFLPSSGKLISLMQGKYHKMKFMRKRIDQILGKHEDKRVFKGGTLPLMDAIKSL